MIGLAVSSRDLNPGANLQSDHREAQLARLNYPEQSRGSLRELAVVLVPLPPIQHTKGLSQEQSPWVGSAIPSCDL